MIRRRPLAATTPAVALAVLLAISGLTAACARDPLPRAATPAATDAPYPKLVPLESIAALPAPDDPAAGLAARADALRARAAALQAEG